MVAYLHKAPRNSWVLTIVKAPCNGAEYQAGEKLKVAGRREAKALCKALCVTPYNF